MTYESSHILPPDWSSCTEEELWHYIAWHLEATGIHSVLVGGAVVSIYTEGLYRSGDIDLVPDDLGRGKIASALATLGFVSTKGRYFRHPECLHLVVEFPPGPVSLGEEVPVTPVEVEVAGLKLSLLSPTDCIKDRLAGWIHWGYRANFDQALLVALRQGALVQWPEIRRWCDIEGGSEAFEELRQAFDHEMERTSRSGPDGSPPIRATP